MCLLSVRRGRRTAAGQRREGIEPRSCRSSETRGATRTLDHSNALTSSRTSSTLPFARVVTILIAGWWFGRVRGGSVGRLRLGFRFRGFPKGSGSRESTYQKRSALLAPRGFVSTQLWPLDRPHRWGNGHFLARLISASAER